MVIHGGRVMKLQSIDQDEAARTAGEGAGKDRESNRSWASEERREEG